MLFLDFPRISVPREQAALLLELFELPLSKGFHPDSIDWPGLPSDFNWKYMAFNPHQDLFGF
jgi:hypothetical protein